MDKVYSAQDIAAMLRVTEDTVWRWLLAGKLKGFKAGGCWRVTEPELNKFLQLNGREIKEQP